MSSREPADLHEMVNCVRSVLQGYYAHQVRLCQARLDSFEKINWELLTIYLEQRMQQQNRSLADEQIIQDVVAWVEATLND